MPKGVYSWSPVARDPRVLILAAVVRFAWKSSAGHCSLAFVDATPGVTSGLSRHFNTSIFNHFTFDSPLTSVIFSPVSHYHLTHSHLDAGPCVFDPSEGLEGFLSHPLWGRGLGGEFEKIHRGLKHVTAWLCLPVEDQAGVLIGRWQTDDICFLETWLWHVLKNIGSCRCEFWRTVYWFSESWPNFEVRSKVSSTWRAVATKQQAAGAYPPICHCVPLHPTPTLSPTPRLKWNEFLKDKAPSVNTQRRPSAW